MAYKLIITKHADELLDNIPHYLIYQLANEQAAVRFLDEIKNIYDRLEENLCSFQLVRIHIWQTKDIVRLLLAR